MIVYYEKVWLPLAGSMIHDMTSCFSLQNLRNILIYNHQDCTHLQIKRAGRIKHFYRRLDIVIIYNHLSDNQPQQCIVETCVDITGHISALWQSQKYESMKTWTHNPLVTYVLYFLDIECFPNMSTVQRSGLPVPLLTDTLLLPRLLLKHLICNNNKSAVSRGRGDIQREGKYDFILQLKLAGMMRHIVSWPIEVSTKFRKIFRINR